jgi:hypothetical protein
MLGDFENVMDFLFWIGPSSIFKKETLNLKAIPNTHLIHIPTEHVFHVEKKIIILENEGLSHQILIY